MPDDAFVEHLLELLEPFGEVTARRMFGGYGIFRKGLMFGLVADAELYFKTDTINAPEFDARGLESFFYEKGDRIVRMSYRQAPPEVLDDGDVMLAWADSAFQAALRAQR